jgi:hypothetical protein
MGMTGQLVLDSDVASVAEFIERSIPADRRMYVAERLSEVAQLIWADTHCAVLRMELIREMPLSASELLPADKYAGDGSGAGAGLRRSM